MGRVFHQRRPLPRITAQAPDLSLGPERCRKQSVGVELLQPLAVQHVALAPGHVLDSPRVHQHHLEPLLLQPIGQTIQVRRERGELAHWLLAAASGTATKWLPDPTSIPAASRFTRDSSAGRRSRLLPVFLAGPDLSFCAFMSHPPLQCRRVARRRHQTVTIYRTGAPPQGPSPMMQP